jgi:hypothetical protein
MEIKTTDIRTVKHARGIYLCGNCSGTINHGEMYIWWPVKRGYAARCSKPECLAAIPETTVNEDTVVREQRHLPRNAESAAIDAIEARGYSVQYLCGGMYRIQPTRGGAWPSYYQKTDLVALAEMTKQEMRQTVAGDQRPNPWVLEAEQTVAAGADGDEVEQFNRDELLIAAEDILREREAHAITVDAWVAANATGVARCNRGRYAAALAAMVERRAALVNNAAATVAASH